MAEIDFHELERQSNFHQVAAMVGYVISNSNDGGILDKEQREYWKEAYYHSVRDSLLIDRELEQVCGALSDAHVGYVKLKGSVLRSYYPKRGMREMCDVDLLIDPDKTEQAKNVMTALGYTVEEYGVTHHDIYSKPPIYRFELHNKMLKELYSDYIDYYRHYYESLSPVSPDGYERKMTDDQFYLFLITHACKHLHRAGVGLRVLTDIFVVNRSFALHRDFIDRELPKLGLVRDEMNLRSLSEKLFSSPESTALPALSRDEENLLAFMLNSGAKGTFEQRVNNLSPQGVYADQPDTSKNKWYYIKNRLILNPNTYRTKYPFFYRHKIARPLLPIVRLAKTSFKREGKIRDELNKLRKATKKSED
nr:nucleotidyltransferase family protein [uncultured Ruminococcus sp.]